LDGSFWHTVLIILGWTGFGLSILVALFLNLLGLFGNWLLIGTLGLAWWLSGFVHFGPWWVFLIYLALAILGEVLETAVSGYGARKFGGSPGAMVAALVGCFVGLIVGTPLIPIPIVGSLIGACIGGFCFAAVYDYIQHERSAYDAAWIGMGAAVGKVGGLFAKFFCGLLILIVALIQW